MKISKWWTLITVFGIPICSNSNSSLDNSKTIRTSMLTIIRIMSFKSKLKTDKSPELLKTNNSRWWEVNKLKEYLVCTTNLILSWGRWIMEEVWCFNWMIIIKEDQLETASRTRWEIAIKDKLTALLLCLMELYTQESYSMEWKMDTDSKSGRMDQSTMGSGNAIKQMAMVPLFMQMVISMRVSGWMTKLMDMELTSMPMEPRMLVNGLKINNMDTVSRNGQMVQNMRANIKMGRSMAMAN